MKPEAKFYTFCIFYATLTKNKETWLDIGNFEWVPTFPSRSLKYKSFNQEKFDMRDQYHSCSLDSCTV